MAREHDEGVEATVFHNDVRSYGKGFEQYYRQVSGMPGVRYIRSIVSTIKELPATRGSSSATGARTIRPTRRSSTW